MLKCSRHFRTQNLLHEVRRAVDAKRIISQLPLEKRDNFLRALVSQVSSDREYIYDENRRDCDAFMRQRSTGEKAARPGFSLTPLWMDRLLLGIERLISLPDPLASVPFLSPLPTAPDIAITQVTVPLGMVAVISRYRPRIMLDAVAMCIRSGNVCLVDGGMTVSHTNRALLNSVQRALSSVDLPGCAVVFNEEPDEKSTSTTQWLRMNDFVDVVVCCGSTKLYDYVYRNTNIPIIRSTGHVCSLYVDKDADYNVVLEVVNNAKFQRANATNSINNLLIHSEFDRTVDLLTALTQQGTRILGDEAVQEMFPTVALASEEDWMGLQNGFANFNFLAVKMIRRGVEEVAQFMDTYGSRQSDGIITKNEATAAQFVKLVDSAVVFVNASTRFSSAECFGLAVDLAVATSRTHCRGPVGLSALTTTKYVVTGTNPKGSIRK